ncbi:MAG TPA: PA14 domain-containing protein [Armatimonadota bacterium]
MLVSGVALVCLASGGAWAQQATGLLGQYYSWDPTLACIPDREAIFTPANLDFARIDKTVNFGNPFTLPGTTPHQFGARWTGYIVVPTTGEYQFTGRSDDGMRIWISENPATAIDPANPGTAGVDAWVAQGEGADFTPVSVNMTAGQKYPVMIEFAECGGGNAARFRYTGPSMTASAIVPTTMLVPPTPKDTTAPAAITDLKAGNVTAGAVTLTWTAPGNDGATGTATGYDVRYSTVAITPANFASATSAGLPPRPKAAGGAETMTLTLDPLQKFFFAVVAVDQDANQSALSNVPEAQTLSASSVPDLPTLPKVVDKAVYYDTEYTTGWISDADGAKIRDYFVGKGYKLVTASGMADFMTSHATSKTPSVVVIARDNMPDTVVDISSGGVVADNIVNNYMNNGGRVVWPQDIPFYDIAQTGGGKLNAAGGGGTTILGVGGGTWDIGDAAKLTAAGVALGLAASWNSIRPTDATGVHLVLATGRGGAAEWIKFFPDKNGPGYFARMADHSGSMTDAEIADLQTIAELPPATSNTRGRLNGTINDATGAPLAGATVVVAPATGTALSTTTDANGFYSVMAAPGSYTISGSGPTPSGIKGIITGTGPVSVTENTVTTAPTFTIAPEPLPTFPAVVDKGVYYDNGFTTGWTQDAAAQGIRDYFKGKGYTVLDAAALATFLKNHATSKTASVVVGSQDILPDTVIDLSSGAVTKKNIINDYLNNGGRWIAFGDIPFYNIGKSDMTNFNAADGGSTTILGFSAGGGQRDVNDTVVLTPTATALGLTSTWGSLRPAKVANIDITLESARGGAAGWIKLYPDNTGTGFFGRISDYNIGAGPVPDPQLADAQKIAELSGTIGGVTPPPPTVVYGDLNGDKKVSIADVVLALRGVAGLVTLTADQQTAGDVSGDKKFNITDVVLMLRYVAGLITKFPVQG